MGMKPAAACVGDDIVMPTCMERCQLHLAPSSKNSKAKDGTSPCLLVCLRQKDFQAVSEGFGRSHHVGSRMPREIPKSWTYLQEGWNTHARAPVTEAIEAAVAGDN